jgi:hypothetical protein
MITYILRDIVLPKNIIIIINNKELFTYLID